jgi:hypothetical protein
MLLANCLFLETNFAINADIAARHAMAIHITKNGQQLGPYSMAEVQNLLRSGTVAVTDLAWQEGLPNWIPLYQIPGFVFVPPAPPTPPVATTTHEQTHRLPAQNKSILQKIGTGIVAIGVLLLKFAGPILVLLKTGGTMLLSIGAYSLLWGWKFAAGLVLLIFVHEMGHFISARCYRIKAHVLLSAACTPARRGPPASTLPSCSRPGPGPSEFAALPLDDFLLHRR